MKKYVLIVLVVVMLASCSASIITKDSNAMSNDCYAETCESKGESQQSDDLSHLVKKCKQSLPTGWKNWRNQIADFDDDGNDDLFSWVVQDNADNMSKSHLWFTNKTETRMVDKLPCSFGEMNRFTIAGRSVLTVQVGQAGFKFWFLNNGDPQSQQGGLLCDVKYSEDIGCIVAYSTGVYSKPYYYGCKETENGPLFFEYGGYKGNSIKFCSFKNSQMIVDDLVSNGYSNILDYIYRDIGIVTLNVKKARELWSINYSIIGDDLVEIGKYASPYDEPFANSPQNAIYPEGCEPINNDEIV